MMYGMDWGAGWSFGPLFMILLWTLIVAGTVWLVLAARGQALPRQAHASALAILEERLARGEIDAEEFKARRAAIGGAS